MSGRGARKAAGTDNTIGRREYLDWLRGIAVLIMIEAHVIDSWTRFPDRTTRAYFQSIILGGFGAPLFLFLAGVAVALSASAKFRKSGDTDGAARAVVRRGGEIFVLAFLFRIQAWTLGGSPIRQILKVDILNIMGPSIVLAALLWGAARTTTLRIVAFAGVTIVVSMMTPIVRNIGALSVLPDPIEGYINPVPDLTNFAFFPWAGLLFAGGLAGVILDASRDVPRERRINLGFLAAGLGVDGLAYWLSFRPSIYPVARFWTTSPTYFFIRVGLMTAAIALAYLWGLRPGGGNKWSPLRQLGRTSLFIYWIHVEMVYGLISIPLHKSLSLRGAWIAFAIFCVFMLVCSIAKDRVVKAWNAA